ncbi:MAG: hypothetical protein HY292_22570 [Planctomycetes bacterium]|nr:hypothetical protein [Planctomycetota bacterium]
MLDRWWLLSCVAVLVALGVPPQKKPAPPKPRRAMLQAVELSNPDRIPLACEYVVADHVPEALVPGSHRIVATAARLEIDSTGDGNTDARVVAETPKVVAFWEGDKKRQVLFYTKLGTWYAAPGGVLRGTIEGVPIELLDADQDGGFIGAKDYIRWGDGAYTRQLESHLIAGDHELWTYAVRREDHRISFEVTLDPRPPEATDVQWAALMAANRFRRRIGLPPLRLDFARCAACDKHADYLLQNPDVYGAPWNGVGPHDETPENPGFSNEGKRAAQMSSITNISDPAWAVGVDTSTMLHRVNYLCAASEGFGVGRVERVQETSRVGYSVMWTGWESTADVGGPIVVPGPGERGVPLICTPEIPPVENPADFYSKPRGYPVSVTFAEMPLTQLSLKLFDDRGAASVRGTCFTPALPIHSTRPQNARSAFFVADEPLRRAHAYVAVFTAKEGDRAIRLVWGFTTQ